MTETLTVDILIGQNQVLDVFETLEKQSFKLGRASALGFDVSKEISDLNKLQSEFSEFGNIVTTSFKRGEAAANHFDFRLLSILFAGMALQRTFGGFARNLINTYTKAEDNTSGLSKATTRLTASFEFLKFSLIDALDNESFIGIIDGIVGVIDWVSRLPEGVRAGITGVIGALALIGTGAVIWSTIKLAWGALFGIGGILTKLVGQTTTAVKVLQTSVIALDGLTLAGLIGAFAAATVAIGTALYLTGKLFETLSQFDGGTPSVNDIAKGPIDNIDVLDKGVTDLEQSFSNLNYGLDSTIEIQNELSSATGDFESHIVTLDDKFSNIIKTAERYADALNNIPTDITTTVRIKTEGDTSSFNSLRNFSSVSGGD